MVDQHFLLLCPQCKSIMSLERIVPKLAPLPELREYKCSNCGIILKREEELKISARKSRGDNRH